MSFYVIETEYDIDHAIRECTKLMGLNKSRVKVAFNNMRMVHIFMNNLAHSCDTLGIDSEDRDFHLDVLINVDNGDS